MRKIYLQKNVRHFKPQILAQPTYSTLKETKTKYVLVHTIRKGLGLWLNVRFMEESVEGKEKGASFPWLLFRKSLNPRSNHKLKCSYNPKTANRSSVYKKNGLQLPPPLWTSATWLIMSRALSKWANVRHRNGTIRHVTITFWPVKPWGCRWRRDLWYCPGCIWHLTQALISTQFFLSSS